MEMALQKQSTLLVTPYTLQYIVEYREIEKKDMMCYRFQIGDVAEWPNAAPC